MTEDPGLLIIKWTLQRWKLCPSSSLSGKLAHLKIAAYLTDLFVFEAKVLLVTYDRIQSFSKCV